MLRTLEEIYAEWYATAEHIATYSGRWLNFSMWCGIIGAVLSVVALVLLIIIIRRESND